MNFDISLNKRECSSSRPSHRKSVQEPLAELTNENDISLSFDTDAFATESARHSALKLKREREKEIRRLRDNSQAFEEELKTTLGQLRDQARSVAYDQSHQNATLKVYKDEYCRLEESLGQILNMESPREALLESVITPRNKFFRSHSRTASRPSLSPIPDATETLILTQLQSLNLEMQRVQSRLEEEAIARKASEIENDEIKQTLKRLENSLFELGAPVDESIKIEKPKKTSCETCKLF